MLFTSLYAMHACMHHLVVFLINFTTVCMLLLGSFFAMRTCMHHLVVFLCHVCKFTSLVDLKTLLVERSYPCQLGLALSDVSGYFDVVAHE